MGRCGLLVIMMCSLVVWVGCGRVEAPPRPNVLLVTFDTTRWDHLGYATGRPGLTPMLDAMAQRGVWFSQAVTTQPLTVPSHTTILTGLYPYHHGVRNNGTYVVGAENVTLAERLRDVGYQTHAVVSAFVLDSQFGLDQGFTSYDDDLSGGPKQKMFMFKESPAALTTVRGAHWLRQGWDKKAPFFLWMHYFDPHADYEPPPDVRAQHPGDPYQAEIAYADRELGRLFKELDELGVLDQTLVVFTSDHGDSLGEHGEKTHGLFIYDATMRVPLLVAGPGVPSGGRVDGQVRTADIVPTVMELLQLPGREALDGASLVPLWSGEAEQRSAYLETFVPRQNFAWSELRGLRTDALKAIQAPRPELYALPQDPGERTNLYGGGSHPGGQALFEQLASVWQADPVRTGGHAQASLSQEMEQKLSALGYVWTDEAPAEGELPDPKDRIVYWERFQYTQALMRARRFEDAVVAIRQLLIDDPGNVMARTSLANALLQTGHPLDALEIFQEMIGSGAMKEAPYLGAARVLRDLKRFEEAEALGRRVVELQPRNPEGYGSVGDTLLEQERYAEAETWFRKALEVDPNASLAATGLGNCLNRSGKVREAQQVLAVAWARDKTSYAVAYNLAVVTDKLGDPAAALELYRQALALEPDHSMTWNNVGSLLQKKGQVDEALRHLRKAHELDPENVEACFNLGMLLLLKKDPGAALPLFEDALRLRPGFVLAELRRAQALEGLGRVEEARAALTRIAPGHPGAWLALARMELRAGSRERARAALEAGLRADGDRFRAALREDKELAGLLESG